MELRNTKETYGKMAIGLHWLMALMVLGLIAVGFLMEMMGKGPTKMMVVNLHKATGLMVLLIGLFRWYWTITNQTPSPLGNPSKAETGISHATKWLLMLLLLGMPLSGILMSMFHGHGINVYGLFEVPVLVSENKDFGKLFGRMHGLGAWVISAMVLLHILGAVKNQFINKDKSLDRMLGRK